MDGSFELKESQISNAGVGVFTKVPIQKDSYLQLKPKGVTVGVVRDKKDIPDESIRYCIAQPEDKYLCPADFKNMELVWYLNHSFKPNARKSPEGYYANRDISAGEEILIDYNVLGEPEEKKESFYKK